MAYTLTNQTVRLVGNHGAPGAPNVKVYKPHQVSTLTRNETRWEVTYADRPELGTLTYPWYAVLTDWDTHQTRVAKLNHAKAVAAAQERLLQAQRELRDLTR